MSKNPNEYKRGFIPKKENVRSEHKVVITAPQDFEGREEDLSFIEKSYESGTRIIVLWGIGGIGKTTLARQFIVNSKYSCPQEVFFGDEENQEVTFSDLLLKLNYSAETLKKYVFYKTNKFEAQAESVFIDYIRSLDSNTILFIDNINVLTNELINKLIKNTNCKILITARQFNNTKQIGAVDYEVKQLNEEIAGRIFQKIYGNFESNEKDLFESDVYGDFLGNTNAIILVGKMLKTQGLDLNNYVTNKRKHLNDNLFTGEIHEKERPYDTIARNLCEFLNITQALINNNEDEMNILRVMMLIEQLGIREQYLCNALHLKNRNELIRLECKGLIRCETDLNSNGIITMHPMIALALELYGITCNDSSIKKIVLDYLNTAVHNEGLDKDMKAFTSFERVISKFWDKDKVGESNGVNDKSSSASYKVIPSKGEDLLDILLDEDNKNPIVLGDEKGRIIKFEQVAIVPYNNELYCVLKPIDAIEGVGADEAIVFVCVPNDNGATVLKVETNEKIKIAVFERYYLLLLEANVADGE